MPNLKLIVNFDVPSCREITDFSNYFHRISRCCHFVKKVAALTLIDRPEDKRMMDEIVAYYSIQDKIQQLENPEVLSRLLKKFVEEEQGGDS